jgi:hypothetical protein
MCPIWHCVSWHLVSPAHVVSLLKLICAFLAVFMGVDMFGRLDAFIVKKTQSKDEGKKRA